MEILWLVFSILICVIFLLLSAFFFQTESSIFSSIPFECGMESPSTSSRVPFCLHFYMVVVIFLIFDIEFVLSFPLLFLSLKAFYWVFYWGIFLSVIFAGLIVEISFGSVDWKE
nr:NADH dehydrogenase subunit 3 [Oxylipeurus chiniri]UTN43096.1 NADH dehydrogenase subunit 3 [Oxylipeurus chiniri]